MFKYETHLHTHPVSKCARVGVREVLEYYKSLGFEGIFLTNHFLDGNINIERERPYEERINFYFSDYEEACALADEIGIKVFLGVEISYAGTDFLIYGLDKAWYLEHPEIMQMSKKQELAFLMEQGALVIQAHPFRESGHIDHIRLFPRSVHGVEIINACRNDFENEMARHYADSYGLLYFAGTDNHVGAAKKSIAGMQTETPITSELDFVERVKNGEAKVFFDQYE
ncbi:MAG: histidinol phosphatase [Clostridia bacterium]|nr:histidinol phosphatase [Clostridia bacterium]